MLQILSGDINNGCSFLDVFILKIISQEKTITIESLERKINEKYKTVLKEDALKKILNILNLNFFFERKGGQRTPIGDIYNFQIINMEGNSLSIGNSLEKALQNNVFNKFFFDSLSYSLKLRIIRFF